MTTGQRAWWLTWVLTDPISSQANPPAPRDPTTIMSAPGRRPGAGMPGPVEQSGKELADLGEDGDQPFMERIHGTRYYG